ncbi:MAG: ATP-binding cassette domain-containing protein [Methylobacterium mesophilicum]|nr:ATP-binding cassette domain-containing protein [Methylobacterium mesophilicum]
MAAAVTGLQLSQIEIRLDEAKLFGIDAHVAPGTVLTVMGPSGSGKSTLLGFLGGFLPKAFSASGRVEIDGRDITTLPPQARGAGLLFQDALLFPHMSVLGNLLFAIPPAVKPRAAREAAAEKALTEMGLETFGPRHPDTLSGGQRARVALARTLLSQPRFLLLDEPFSRLDAPLRAQARALVFSEAQKRALPVVLVTHDRADAEAADGPVIEIGTAA